MSETPGRRRVRIAGALLGVIALTAVVFSDAGTRVDSADLTGDFAVLQNRIDGFIGIAAAPLGGAGTPMFLGQWQTGPAWSTMKVPLVMAALRAQESPGITPQMTAAITRSDNGAAEAIWAGLGDPLTAARRVQAVLSQAGDPTVVESQRLRSQFSAFGQTEWSLSNQAHFLAVAGCDGRNAAVMTLMGQIEAGQKWGLAALGGARFKGGWGPYPSGKYLQRQVGLITTPTGVVAVAIAAEPNSGSYSDGIRDLDTIAAWLAQHLASLPAGRCPS